MTLEPGITWLILGGLALLNVGMIVMVQTERSQQKQVLRFWHHVGLPMGSQKVADSLRRRLRRSAIAASTGALAGLVVSAGILFFSPSSFTVTFAWTVVLPTVFIGTTAFDVCVALRDTLFRQPPGTPRLARAEAVSLGDYISPVRLWVPPVLLLLAVLFGALVLALGLFGVIEVGAFGQSQELPILLIALLVLCGSAVLASRALQQPQPVTDVLELAWDDALRAETLRKLALLATLTSWLAIAAVGNGLINAFDSTGSTDGSFIAPQLFNWGYIAALYLFSFGGAYSYFRYRLWPNFTFSTVDATGTGSG
ncbi:hypothetical protein [Arthrobacter sp. GMC3]|uniref:hypothetical protein n=1 Tax=Arthrobacter sp. GMC3 TaxID=2058894 RepID=UPI000CE393B5|nr:hypothetical protein [Arthrobacter sp. GMC3]